MPVPLRHATILPPYRGCPQHPPVGGIDPHRNDFPLPRCCINTGQASNFRQAYPGLSHAPEDVKGSREGESGTTGIIDMNVMTSPPKPGIYARGTETVDAILKAALSVLIDEGAAAFTIRRIAARADMKVGNVSYHFPRKEMLIQVLLDELIESYGRLLEERVRRPGLSAEERLRLVIILCLDDIRTKRTTHLFTELWALANHDDFVAERVQIFYRRVHDVIGEYVAQLNPALTPDEVHTLALYISASMEGATAFLGYGKPWSDKMDAFKMLAVKSLVELAKTASARDIAALPEAVA